MSDQVSDLPIGPEPVDPYDVRGEYPDYPQSKVHAAWPCAWCGIRRDEHASDPTESRFPELDITDHVFTPLYDIEICADGKWRRSADGSLASDMESAAAIWGSPAVAANLEAGIEVDRPDHPEKSCANCGHSSDCATHNEPAMPAGPCNCAKGGRS